MKLDWEGVDWAAMLETVMGFAARWGVKVLGVLVLLLVGWIAAGWSRRALRRVLERRKFDATLTGFFSNLMRWSILAVVVVGALSAFGIETTSFAAVLGALGLAVGLAFQGTLSNFSAGVMLLVFRPFKVGDVISTSGVVGVVKEIELFTTELTPPDNRRIIVPNSQIFGAIIENLTDVETRRVDVPVGVEYGADVDRTREVLEAMIPAIPGVLADPPPQVFLDQLGASSVDWVVRVWAKTGDYWDVRQATVKEAKKALDGARIGIPFPQMDVHLDPGVVSALSRN